MQIRKQNHFSYEGQVLLNSQNFHGFGRLSMSKRSESESAFVYEGWFVNGLPQGFGRKVYEDGSVYEG